MGIKEIQIMARRKISYIAAIAMAYVLGACNSTELSDYQQGDVHSIKILARDFEGAETLGRTSVTIGSEGAVFSWAENDTIGIFPNSGYQVAFPMESGAGSQHAEFTGGGWSLRSTYLYAAYYPFQFNNKSRENVIVTYEGQEQSGNRSLKHIGAYDYMAAPMVVPEEGKVTFNFQHLGTLLQWKLKLPVAGNVLSMSLVADDAVFIRKGVVDLSKRNPSIEALELDSLISLDLSNIKSSKDGEEIVLYMMMAPINLSSKNYSLQLTNEAGKVSTVKLKGQNFEAGKTYAISADMPEFVSASMNVDEYKGVVVSHNQSQILLESPFVGKSQFIMSDDVKEWLTLKSNTTTNNGSYQLDVAANPTDSTRRGLVWVRNLQTRQIVEFAVLQSGTNGYAVTETNGRMPIGVITANCEHVDETHGLSALVDKNLNTYFEGYITEELYLNWEGPYPITICSLEYGGGIDEACCPTRISMHISVDGIDWQGLGWSVTSGHFANYLSRRHVQQKSRFFRFVVSTNNGGPTTQVSEFGLTIDTDVEL